MFLSLVPVSMILLAKSLSNILLIICPLKELEITTSLLQLLEMTEETI